MEPALNRLEVQVLLPSTLIASGLVSWMEFVPTSINR
jgi:hypothetical protein